MTRSRSARALATRGYLPKEIPPAFSSASLNGFSANFLAPVPGQKRSITPTSSETSPVEFSIPAAEKHRRRLEIPAPGAFLPLTELLGSHWAEIGRLMDRSDCSLSRPVLNRNLGGRALTDRLRPIAQRREKMSRAGLGRVTVALDTSSFYGSVYTHAIDWAIRGKGAAKANQRDHSFGSLVDQCLQSCRLNQTTGIAIGPDTSRVVSEIVMAAIDRKVQDHFPRAKRSAWRYIDDVTFYGRSMAEGEEFAEIYVAALSEYELNLNDSKRLDAQTVLPIDAAWLHPVAEIQQAIRKSASEGALVVQFNRLQHLIEIHGTSPLRFILPALPPSTAQISTWPLFLSLLNMNVRRDSLLLSHLHRWLLAAKAHGYISSYRSVQEDLEEFMDYHIQRRHGWEVGYIVNILTDLGIPVSNRSAERAALLESDLVDLLILEAATKVRRLKTVAAGIETRGMSASAFTSSHWLLAYEVQRTRPGSWTSEFRTGIWRGLASANISFIRDPRSSATTQWYRARLAQRARRASYSSPS